MDERLRSVDEDLVPLLPALRAAVQSRQLTVALGFWQRVRFVGLLPFHLHLRWPDCIERLPLNASFAMVPFVDAHLLSIPLYRVSAANEIRRSARLARHEARRCCPNDLVHTDWERGFDKHRAKLGAMVLPGTSFIAADFVSPTGAITKGHRPLLGRFTVREGWRPIVRLPNNQGVSAASAHVLSTVDLLVITSQGLRGRRVLESARYMIRARGVHAPSLIVASTPNDLIALGLEDLVSDAPIFTFGTLPHVSRVTVTTVSRDRPLLDREFEFAVAELSAISPAVRNLVELARSAWWAVT
jgi:hypothetical protein